AAALGLRTPELQPGAPIRVGSTGSPFLYVPLRDRTAVDRAALDVTAMRRAAGDPLPGVFVFCAEDTGAYSRMFAPPLPSIAAAGGRTPLVKLNRVTSGARPAVYLKIEWFGPSGSLKDRIYLWMFERAEARGDLKPGMRVLECSTGNAGIACAFVAAVKGYPCTIVMPEGMSEERKKIMRAYGADLVFTPGGESDVDLSLRRLEEIRAG